SNRELDKLQQLKVKNLILSTQNFKATVILGNSFTSKVCTLLVKLFCQICRIENWINYSS
ncbi:hypothetical protein, partial [Dapis sp. BLCC M229]|uniref:hypothetical protein n=1 Tax=Dapis sp. BLCC M229 TaxID=3400188 RepID=UPI003CFB95A3